MRIWSIIALVVLSAGIFLVMFSATARAQGPTLDRCKEYLYPYTPTEWERCVGNEFNKFPTAPPELKDAYVRAPLTGYWPAPRVIELGSNAPLLTFPEVDWNGQVYIAPPDSKAYDAPAISPPPLATDHWWQQPASELPQMPPVDQYTAWQNYWSTGGATPYGGWESPQTYRAPGW